MSAEQTASLKQIVEQQLTNAAAEGVRQAKLVLLRGAIMLAADVTKPEDLAALIPAPRAPEVPTIEVESSTRKVEVLNNCQAAFDFAIATQLDSDQNYILPAPAGVYKSEYVCIASETGNPTYLHRPTVFNEEKTRYAFWIRERVQVGEAELNLPSFTYREFGIDAQGNMEEKLTLGSDAVVYRTLSDYEALPYQRALTPIVIRPMTAEVTIARPAAS